MALLPAVSARSAASGDARFNDTYVRASRYVNFATLFLVGFTIAAGRPICYLWVGTDYPGMGTIVALVGLSFILINATMVGTTMLRAVALARFEAYYYLVWTITSIALMLLLVPFFGMLGVLWGMAGGAAAGTVYFLLLFHRLRDLKAWEGFFSWARSLGAISALASRLYRSGRIAAVRSFPLTRLASAGSRIACRALYGGLRDSDHHLSLFRSERC